MLFARLLASESNRLPAAFSVIGSRVCKQLPFTVLKLPHMLCILE